MSSENNCFPFVFSLACVQSPPSLGKSEKELGGRMSVRMRGGGEGGADTGYLPPPSNKRRI